MTTSESDTNKASMNTKIAAKKQVSPLAPMKLTYVTHLPALCEFLKKSNATDSATDYLKKHSSVPSRTMYYCAPKNCQYKTTKSY